MESTPAPRKLVGSRGLFMILSAFGASGALHASGFALIEQSGSGLGLAFAGIAASADDAGAMFFNPALLAGLSERRQFALAAHGIDLHVKFEDKGSSLPPAGSGLLPIGARNSDAGHFVPVPSGYASWPVHPRVTVGLGVNAPFGLKTEYDDSWIGRFQGILSSLKTVNVNPALSVRMNEWLVVGAGINHQRADIELTHAVLLSPAAQGRARLELTDESWGWNMGAWVTLPTSTRIGASYRSRLDYRLSGDTEVTTLGGAVLADISGPTSAGLTMPAIAHFSVAQPVLEVLELRADVQWTNWRSVQTLTALTVGTNAARDILHLGFTDTWRFSAGAQYQWRERWLLRGGLAWDGSPVSDDLRTVRLPDEERWWISVGARWRASEHLEVDFGYARLSVDDPDVNLTREQLGAPASFASTVVGGYESAVAIYSLQLNWSY